MFLTRQIKVKPDDAAEILAKENGRICSKMNSSVVTGVFVQPTLGPGCRNFLLLAL